MARWPALQRVAYLIREQLYRLGPESPIIPLSQIDVADAVGLSVVHTNCAFQDLRIEVSRSAIRQAGRSVATRETFAFKRSDGPQ